jgi:hypothetical protein
MLFRKEIEGKNKIHQSAKKQAEDYSVSDPLGSAQLKMDIERRVIELIHQHANLMIMMDWEAEMESSITDDEIRRYLDIAIGESKVKTNQNTTMTNRR